MATPKTTTDRLVFLGTGGARIVVAKQLRASGGIWMSLAGTEFVVDPGPGSLVRLASSRHRLDPAMLAGIIISHRHLDHAGDVNNLVEAMTLGGTRPGGALFAPADALEGGDPVVLRYVRPFLSRVVTLGKDVSYELGGIRFTCPARHRHPGEVYGFRFEIPGLTVSYVADTAFFPELVDCYKADVMIINVARLEPSELDHLHVGDAEALIRDARPRLAILTHFGMTMLRARPWEVARRLTATTGVSVMAASDDRLVLLDSSR
jgi:phosphoribosyl 1,2-cyclic phosphodiesterase